jgi:serine/threonine protein kinase
MNSPNYWLGRLVGAQERYRLEELLGSGGMGQVFLAKDTLLGKKVALKLLRSTLSEDDTFKQRFEREVSVCAALSSEHIVRIDDFGITSEGYPYFVMEQLVGETLAARLKREKHLPLAQAVSIITQVCTGLKIAHQGVSLWRQGQATQPIKVIHRDLKPENIFLVPTGLGDLAKILDFGIAKICEERQGEDSGLTGTDMFIGTFYYASPEQVKGDSNIDERTDIYSLGMILYEMLSATDPFGLTQGSKSPSGIDWALAHTAKAPAMLRSLTQCASLSPEIETIVMRCLSKNPEDRFASVDQLCAALQAELSRLNITPAIAQTFSDSRPELDLQFAAHHFTQPTLPVIPTGESASGQNGGSETPAAIAQPEPIPGTLAEAPALKQVATHPPVLSETAMERMVLEPIPSSDPEPELAISGTVAERPALKISQVPPGTAPESSVRQDVTAIAEQNRSLLDPILEPVVAIATPAQPKLPDAEIPQESDTVAVAPSHLGFNPPQADPLPKPQPKIGPQADQRNKPKLALLGGGAGLGVLVLAGIGYGVWQQQVSQAETAKKLFTEIVSLQTQADYQPCIEKAATFPTQSDRYPDAQLVLNRCRLGKAEQLVSANQFADAITAASLIPATDPAQAKATTLINQSSGRILKIATDTYANSGKTEAAIALLKAIPANTTVSAKAQVNAQQWQQETATNNQRLQTARTALSASQWDKAIATAKQVTTQTPYWNQQKQSIITKAEGELNKLAWQRVYQQQQREQERIRQSQPEPVYQPPAQSSNPPPSNSGSGSQGSGSQDNGNMDLCQGGGALGNCP